MAKAKLKPPLHPTERGSFTLGGVTYTIHAMHDDIWVTSVVRNHLHRYNAHILVDPHGATWLHINGLVCFPCSVGLGGKEADEC